MIRSTMIGAALVMAFSAVLVAAEADSKLPAATRDTASQQLENNGAAPNTEQKEAEQLPQLPVPSENAEKDVVEQPAKSAEEDIELLDIERNIIEYTNAERAKYGLAAFKVDKELMESAREHARWMARNRMMVHTRRPVAENIAMGYPHSSSAVRGWMNSSGHRANILNRLHTRIGVAAYRAENGTIYWCQQFRR